MRTDAVIGGAVGGPTGAPRPRRLRQGAWAGMLVLGGSFVLMLAANLGFSVMGHEDSSVTDFVLQRKLGTIVWSLAKMLAAHLAVGALLGVLALVVAAGLLGRWPRRPKLASGLLVAMAHTALYLGHIRAYPQVHVETLYARGGALAAFQRFITHTVPDWAFTAAAALAFSLVAVALVRGWLAGFRPPRWGWISAGAAATAMMVPTLMPSGRPGGTAQRPNILVIANDSMRPDRMGVYGYGRPTTPEIDAFAAAAVVFEQAYVPLARTFPSWATLLTGLLPHEHGIRHMFPRPDQRLDRADTLPRFLSGHGYRTVVVGDYAGDIFPRMEAGFERVVAPTFNFSSVIHQRTIQMFPALLPYLDNPVGRLVFPDLRGLAELPQTDSTIDDLLTEIDRGDGRPFFIVAFVSSSHFPYAAPDPYYRQFTDPAYTGSSLYLRYRGLTETPETVRAEAAHVDALFDGTIRHFDTELGRVVRHLEARALLDTTVVVLTADHGELLGEHDTIGHGDHLRGRAANHIPLIVRAPGLQPRRVPGLVRSTDLARTLTGLAGLVPPDGFGGVDLAPLLSGEAETLGLLGYGETGLWFTTGGEEFFQKERLPYPNLLGVGEIREDRDEEICLRPDFEDIVTVAKHRAVWNETRKVIYVPTPRGPVIEAWRVQDGETGAEVPDEAPDPVLLEALQAFLREGGRAEIVGGFALPLRPVAEP